VPGWRKSRNAPVSPTEEQIAGYRDLHRIGHGGFSVVYRAYQEGLDRVVALKVLQVEFVDAQSKRRFLREVQLTGRLSAHPNVVTVLDSGLTSVGRPYIAMELYERGSLRDRLLASGRLPLADVLRVGVKIAGALDAAHREGIVHRDVKPQNILVSRYDEPALADFGTARLVAEMDVSARTEALTPFHAAPEVLEGQAPTAASDVYSLGSTLYQLLAGRAAFQRDGDFGIAPLLLRILSEEPPPLRDVPEAVEAVVRRAMDRGPEGRYGTAAELLAALQGLQRGLGLPVTEVPGGPSADGGQSGPPALGTPDPGASVPAAAGAVPASQAEASAGEPAAAVASEEAPAGLEPLAGLPPIAPTQWEFAEKTGYRTGHQPPPQNPPGPAPPDGITPGQGAAGLVSPGGWSSDHGATDPGAAAHPADAARTRRRSRTATLAVVGALAIIAIAVPLVLAGMRHGTPQPRPSGHVTMPATTAGPRPQATLPASTPPDAVAENAAPVGLTVTVAGPIATLRWRLEPGDPFPLIVDEPSVGAAPVPLPAGSTTYTVLGVHAGTEYCFKVGAVTALGATNPTTKWSNVACAVG